MLCPETVIAGLLRVWAADPDTVVSLLVSSHQLGDTGMTGIILTSAS